MFILFLSSINFKIHFVMNLSSGFELPFSFNENSKIFSQFTSWYMSTVNKALYRNEYNNHELQMKALHQPILSTLPRPVKFQRIPHLSASHIRSMKDDINNAINESTKQGVHFDCSALYRVCKLNKKDFLYEMDKVCSRKRRLCWGGQYVYASIRGDRFYWILDTKQPMIHSICFQDIDEIYFYPKQYSFKISLMKELIMKVLTMKVLKRKVKRIICLLNLIWTLQRFWYMHYIWKVSLIITEIYRRAT